VLGTTLVVFAPVPELGLIVVDEEHDPSFKQHEGGFRYSARDLAVMRAAARGRAVLLGSATPALETCTTSPRAAHARLRLLHRAGESQPPRLALLDLRTSAMRAGVATPAVLAIERHLADDGQVLVFLNRRGYAPTLLCTACGWIAPCREWPTRGSPCISLPDGCAVITAAPTRRCRSAVHQCGFAVKPVGQGTQRIEESLGTLFPGVTIARLEPGRREKARRPGGGDAPHVLGEARILVGTQMVHQRA